MISGKITADKEAVVELEVFGLTRREKIAIVVDTGFTGHLLLPNDFINDGPVTDTESLVMEI